MGFNQMNVGAIEEQDCHFEHIQLNNKTLEVIAYLIV